MCSSKVRNYLFSNGAGEIAPCLVKNILPEGILFIVYNHKIITKVFIKLLTLRGKLIKQSVILIIQYQTSMMLDNLNRK
jgi:hypothetical protein